MQCVGVARLRLSGWENDCEAVIHSSAGKISVNNHGPYRKRNHGYPVRIILATSSTLGRDRPNGAME